MLPRPAARADPRPPPGRSRARLTPLPLLTAVAIAAVVAVAVWRLGALTGGGACAATIVGMLVLVGTGWSGGAVLGVFFVSSSLLSSFASGSRPANDAKGDRRDHWQVIANGGPAAIASLLGVDHLSIASPTLALWIVTCSLAAAAADTWATSIGARSPTPPHLLVGWREVAAGTSGGVTMRGTLGGLAGGAVVAGVGALAGGDPRLLAAGTLIGFAGMLVDSALGGTLQGRFFCARCGAPSEWRIHRCGEATVRRGGIAWLNNDAVNLAATSLAAAAGAAAWRCWAS